MRRIVVIAPYLPFDGIEHGGGQYLQRLHLSLRDRARVTFIVPGYVAPDLGRSGSPEHVIVLARFDTARGAHLLALRLAGRVWGLVGRIDGNAPDLPFFLDLLLSRAARVELAEADVVDLQWPHYVRMAPLVRLLNARAHVVLTVHDVASQRFSRLAAATPGPFARRRFELMAAIARASERRVLRNGQVVVFSTKDADLLPKDDRSGRPTVINLPLASGPSSPPRSIADPLEVLFVGALSRPENEDALSWFVTRVWPNVLPQCPGACLTVVGRGAGPRLLELLAGRSDIRLAGFVEDLAGEYARAAACVVPLRLGAGVKIKTVEALLAGVPTVTTSVGAEGIGGDDLFAGLTDDPEILAERLVWALRHPGEAEEVARRAQEWASKVYGMDAFNTVVEQIYLGERAPEPQPR